MKKIATVISAASLAVISASASAWGWGDNGYNNGWGNNGFGDGDFDGDFGFSMSARGSGRGRGHGYNDYRGYNGYGYAPYGYAPYGYGAPVAPAVEMTDEQKQAIADQQAKYVEDMQKAQQQAAEFHAANPYPGDAFRAQMEAEHQARIKEMDARMEEFKKAADERRKAHEEAYKARLQERTGKVAADKGA
ncbi:MAG: hypothetical protein OEU91_10150 [Gammaproteobacteria bacterium]|nr:hypothetical protein [Gammaproteobacteria bacterium]